MRSRQPEAAATPKTPATAPAQPRTPARATHPLLALQRGYGNRFVQRLVGGGSTLDIHTRARLERAFGTDLSKVTVSHRPEVAEIGAIAYTRGEQIALAPGQRLNTTEGQELLAHEVAHVIQQRQGRVRPKVQGFNVDTHLEAEADAVARRVSHGEPAGITAPATPATGTVAQGKFGFEFETDNSFIGAGDIAIVGEKEIAYRDDQAGFQIEGDEGTDADHFDVEFITDATDSPAAALRSAVAAASLALTLAQQARTSRYSSGRHPVVLPGGGKWVRRVAIEVEDLAFKASTQGSVGVGFERIPELLAANLGESEVTEVQGMVRTWEQADVNLLKGSPKLQGFLHALAFYVERAAMRNDREDDPPDNDRDWIQLPTETDWQEIVTDGPKANFSVMARTDFHSMHRALPLTDQANFNAMVIGGHGAAIAAALGRHSLEEPMFVDPYRADKDLDISAANVKRFRIVEGTENGTGETIPVVTRSPAIRDWFLSIISGLQYHKGRTYNTDRNFMRKDMMSPPPGVGFVPPGTGFRPTSRQILDNSIYAMGAYRMDTQGQQPLAVFEVRNLGKSLTGGANHIAAARWPQAVQQALQAYLNAGLPARRQRGTRARSTSM